MRRLICILLALVAPSAFAAGDSARDRMEASTVVTGWLQVAPDGSVTRYTLDQQDKLDAGIVKLIAGTIATWKFKPVLVDGKPVVADAKMNLRVVASKRDKDGYELRVRGASFGDGESDDAPREKVLKPPLYPVFAVRSQIEAMAYLALEIDRAGHVEQAVAQQVNLRAVGPERDMKLLREAFAKSSLTAAKEWIFTIPTTGPHANDDHWTVRVPLDFTLTVGGSPEKQRGYGQWDLYVPGPTQPIPWEQDQVASDSTADAVADDGQSFMPDKRFVLLTPAGS